MAFVDALSEDANSSMQRDIAAGKPSELEAQNGAVVRMAHDAGIEVPTHALIYHTLRPLEEQSSRYSLRLEDLVRHTKLLEFLREHGMTMERALEQ